MKCNIDFKPLKNLLRRNVCSIPCTEESRFTSVAHLAHSVPENCTQTNPSDVNSLYITVKSVTLNGSEGERHDGNIRQTARVQWMRGNIW